MSGNVPISTRITAISLVVHSHFRPKPASMGFFAPSFYNKPQVKVRVDRF